jgi:hypothetical protein
MFEMIWINVLSSSQIMMFMNGVTFLCCVGPRSALVSSGPGAAWVRRQQQAEQQPIKIASQTPDGRPIIAKVSLFIFE